jgi:hypothetical protein
VNRKYIPNTSNGTAFVDVLLLPRNRYRSYASDYRGGLATEGIYWTSTPAPNEKAKSSFFTENMSIGNSLLGRNYGL